MVGWLVCWMNGWRVSGQLVGLFWYFVWFVGLSVGRVVRWVRLSECQSVSQMFDCLDSWLFDGLG